jgi:predicted GIY-YIG superfamily endonuclease
MIIIIMALVLMIDTLRSSSPRAVYAASGLFGLILTMVVHIAIDKRRILALTCKTIFTKVRIRVLLRTSVFAVEAPNLGNLLFVVGKGEISESIPSRPIQLFTPSPSPSRPAPPVTIDLGPGFVYVMRRTDGIYKLGRAIDPLQRLQDHQSTYKQDFKLVRCFAVPDMVAFERAALSMTKLYAYKKEVGRKELRKMTKKQLHHFLMEFGELVSIGTIKNIKKASEVVNTNGRVTQ